MERTTLRKTRKFVTGLADDDEATPADQGFRIPGLGGGNIARFVARAAMFAIFLDTGLSLIIFVLTALVNNRELSTAEGDSFRLRCRCDDNRTTDGAAISIPADVDGDGILVSGHRRMTDCRPVWVTGPLSRVFLCNFSTAADRESDISKLRRDLLLLRVKPGQDDQDFRRIIDDLVRRKRRWQERVSRAGTSPISAQEADSQLPLLLGSVIGSVLNGTSCLMSERQFRDLVSQRPWIDLAIFERASSSSSNNGTGNN